MTEKIVAQNGVVDNVSTVSFNPSTHATAEPNRRELERETAERAFIATLLNEPRKPARLLLENVESSDFHYKSHRLIVQAAKSCVADKLDVIPANINATIELDAKDTAAANTAADVLQVIELDKYSGETGETALEFVRQLKREFKAKIDDTTTPDAKPRFSLVSILELLQRPDPTWLIHGVLQSNTNSCLSAAHASFKSFLALDMALCVATGRQWCGRDVIQGSVVYVCAEGASGMKARVQAWCSDKSIEPPPNFHFIDDAVQVHNTQHRADFFAALGVLKPALIVFDTLSLCALGLEENASKDMNLFMDSVKQVQDETGAHILLVHHHSKTGGSRGSTAIPAAVQSEFELKRERDSATLTCTKQKDGAEFKPLTFTSRLVEYDTWRRKSSLVMDFTGDSENVDSLTGNETRVYELLVETFGANGASSPLWWSIADENKIVKGSFYRALKNLVEKGVVDDGKDGKGGRGAIYRPVELLETDNEKESHSQSHCESKSQSLNETNETEKTASADTGEKSLNETNETEKNSGFESENHTNKPKTSESLKVSFSLNETNETKAKPQSLIVSSSLRDETNETDAHVTEKPVELTGGDGGV